MEFRASGAWHGAHRRRGAWKARGVAGGADVDQDPETILVALGGNALSPPGRELSIATQFDAAAATAEHLATLVAAGRRLCVTHGNGPQVGAVLRRVELAAAEVYELPLDVCVADTQGGMGYMIAQCLDSALRRLGIERCVSAVVTRVEVDARDPAFGRPDKPIGPHYDPSQAEELRRRGYRFTHVPGRGLRRVVPSPRPLKVLEAAAVRDLLDAGHVVIAGGGGGIPVVRDPGGRYVGCEAVVDKDLTSALLARAVDARTLVLATEVPGVALDFGTPQQRFIQRLSVQEARHWLAQGQFPPGSMGPKIEAAIDFLSAASTSPAGPGERLAGRRVIVCDLAGIRAALEGQAGTRIEPDGGGPSDAGC